MTPAELEALIDAFTKANDDPVILPERHPGRVGVVLFLLFLGVLLAVLAGLLLHLLTSS